MKCVALQAVKIPEITLSMVYDSATVQVFSESVQDVQTRLVVQNEVIVGGCGSTGAARVGTVPSAHEA
jgi:hypothetical protein